MDYPQARKRFGQNFLQDSAIIDAIVESISPVVGQRIVEIGPGRGALTKPLLEASEKLDVIELDRDLIPLLKQSIPHVGLTIHQADALSFDYSSLLEQGEKLRVVGNLPYNISTPLLFHLLSQSQIIEDMCFMLQQEVVARICAAPGSKKYGRLSVMVQYQCDVEMLFGVPPEAFSPAPKVESAIIYLKPNIKKYQKVDLSDLSKLVTQAFSQRRKTVSNTLKSIIKIEDIKRLGIDPSQRPEDISVESYVELASLLNQK